MVFNEFLQALEMHFGSQQAADDQCFVGCNVIGTVGNAKSSDTMDVVNKWLFAREAEAMGITVDDKTVSTFLDA